MRRAALLLVLLGAVLGRPAIAQAAYGPGADPVSVSYARLEQGDDSTLDADITPDGRYVALQTRSTNFFADEDPDPPGLLRRGGIFRFDRVTHALDFVADGDEVSSADGSLVLRGAANPSISDDGRRVVFSTAQPLVPQDTNDNIDVYVRDMSVPVGPDRRASGAYTLVSARDGSSAPATYAPRDPALPGRSPGADVTPNVAISGDGSRVAFRTVELADDLPASSAADTPPGQVFVRDIAAQRTYLMTATTAGAPAGGATGPAVLSADGSTVVWVGGNAARQTRFLPGERTDDIYHYYLWRRVGGSATRRVTGQADPDDPACPAGAGIEVNPLATGSCYGPLTSFEEDLTNLAQTVPAVSGDGWHVAFLTSQGLRPTAINQTGLDLFLTDMSPGVSRKAGTVELTRDPLGGDARSTGAIQSVAMSADGQHLLLATTRTSFVLPTFSSLGPFRSLPDTTELYVMDLAAHTIDRVMRSTSGGDAAGDAGTSPTASGDASAVAFTSLAGNLFVGDANARADAFVASRVVPRTPGGEVLDDPGGTSDVPFSVDPPADLDVTVKRRKDGGLDVTVRAPGPGTIRLAASASVAASRSFVVRAARTKATVASASKTVTKAGKATIALRLSSKYTKLLKKATRVAATVRTTFVPQAGGSTMSDTETSSFTRPTAKKKATKKTAKSKKKTTKKKKRTKKSSKTPKK